MKVTLTEPAIAGSYVVAEQREDGTLVLRPERSDEVVEQFADRALSEDGMLQALIACTRPRARTPTPQRDSRPALGLRRAASDDYLGEFTGDRTWTSALCSSHSAMPGFSRVSAVATLICGGRGAT